MAELNRNFLKGKMNKDLDERLVPSGQYRDALNIEISTSEGSNVGSAQNLKGNIDMTGSGYSSDSSLTVGTFVDEANDQIYNFVHKASDFTSAGVFGGNTVYTGVRSDAITQYTPDANAETGVTKIVINDIYEVRYISYAQDDISVIKGLPAFQEPAELNVLGDPFVISPLQPIGIRVGMRVQLMTPDGIDYWGANNKIYVTQILSNPNWTDGRVAISNVQGLMLTQDQVDAGYFFRFTAPRILNFKSGTSEVESNHSNEFTDTPANSIITGINMLNGTLYFTDGRNEPKKVVIKDFISDNNTLQKHSKLAYLQGTTNYKFDLKEEHISVLKINPLNQLNVKANTTNRTPELIYHDGLAIQDPATLSLAYYDPVTTSSILEIPTNETSVDALGVPFALHDTINGVPNTILEEGAEFFIQASVNRVHWKVNDIIEITGQTNARTARISIVEPVSGILGRFKVSIVSIDSNYSNESSTEAWTGTLVEKQVLYPEKFVSFAYRYKYLNDEYSCISPYSKPVFRPSVYQYDPKNGFNKGMESRLKSIKVFDFVSESIPDDVVEIELLFKAHDSESVYTIRNIEKDSDLWNANEVVISSEVFGSTLPSDQYDRSFDAVPRSARAQEVSSSRLMYGNYVENYNLLDHSNIKISPSIDSGIHTVPTKFTLTQDNENSVNASLSESISSYHLTDTFNSTDFPHAFSGETYNTISFRFSNMAGQVDAGNYPNFTLFGSKILVPFNIEEYDPGANYSPSSHYITAPADGTISISASLQAHFMIQKEGDSSSNFEGDCKLTVREVNASGIAISDPLLTGSIDSSYHPAANELATGSAVFTVLNPLVSSGLMASLSVSGSITVEAGKNYGVFWEAVDGLAIYGANHSTSAFRYVQFGLGGLQVDMADIESNVVLVSAQESVKTSRSYQVGAVYMDKLGRESTVLFDESVKLNNPISRSANKSKIRSKINNRAPKWATHYKFFVKEIASEYYNIALYKAYDNNASSGEGTNQFVWLSFNSADRSKIDVGDYLIVKKEHGSNNPVNSENARWRALDIVDNHTVKTIDDDDAAYIGETNIGAVSDDLTGKFFVKIIYDADFVKYVGTADVLDDDNVANGAVFEVEKEKIIDLDFFYEVGSAYPIKLDKQYAKDFIKVGDVVELETLNIIPNDTFSPDTGAVYTVENVIGATSFGLEQLNSNADDGVCRVVMNSAVPNVNIPNNAILKLKFIREDGSYVTARALAINGNTIKLYPYTHKTTSSNFSSSIVLPWINCYAFGNGVESDRIRDDFNGKTIFPYTSVGKQSGFKASLPSDDYREEHKAHDIIFSQIINERVGQNRSNEFLLGQSIVKRLSAEYGSIQKLYSRQSDLLAFCEDKVLQILANKDALFNADGSSQLLSSTNVLGFAKPFAGDYGISTNPESFAVDEYRVYFADKSRGSICRLSMDGITPISDAGMKDWFNDNIEYATCMIGSYDGKKSEYNLTIHSILSPLSTKNMYTLTYSEDVKGWSSFKSFMKEAGESLNNNYYTFKKGKMYMHHPDKTTVNRNNFYGTQYTSTITPLFNDLPSVVKHFNTISYEGTQSKVVQNNNAGEDEFYNVADIKGWSVEEIVSDQQEGKVTEFKNKEGKWFNYIQGVETTFTNLVDSDAASGNIDFNEFTVQGLGNINADPTVETGETPSAGNSFSFNFTGTGWSTSGIQLYNQSSIPNTGQFIIFPDPNQAISALDFTNGLSGVDLSSYGIESITFVDTGNANSASNTVEATVTFENGGDPLTSSTSETVPLSAVSVPTLIGYQASLNILYTFPAAPSISFVTGQISSTEISIVEQDFEITQYSIDGNISPNSEQHLFTVKLQAPSGYGWASGDPNLEIEPESDSDNYIVSSNVQGGITKNIVIQYLSSLEDVQATDNNNTINISSDLVLAELFFNSDSFVVDDNANSYVLPLTNSLNLSYFVEISYDSGSDWITLPSSQPNVNNFSFDVSDNDGDSRSATVSITSANNTSGAPDSSITITQQENDFAEVKFKFLTGYDSSGQPIMSTLQSDMDGSLGGRKVFAVGEVVEANGFFNFGQVSTEANFSISYNDPNNADWIEPLGFVDLGFGQCINILNIGPNETADERSAVVTFTNPDDNTTLDTGTLVQKPVYDPNANTLVFKEDSNQNPNNVSLSDAGDNITITSEAQSYRVYIDVPGDDVIESLTGEPSVNVTPSDIITGGVNFINYGTILSNGVELNPDDANYYYEFNIDQNPNFDEIQGVPFYVPRTVTLEGFNPLNNTLNPDDTVTITQQALAQTTFTSEPLAFVTSTTGPITYQVLSNNGAPTVAITGYIDSDSTGSFGAPTWASVSSAEADSSIEYLYNVTITLDQNWTGDNRTLYVAAFNSTYTASGPINPTIFPDILEASQVILTQQYETSTIYWGGTQVYPIIGTNGNFAQVSVLDNTEHTITAPINYNGSEPTLTYSYSDGVNTINFSPTPPSWLTFNGFSYWSGGTIDQAAEFVVAANGTGTQRSVYVTATHSENENDITNLLITQNG